MITGAVPSCAAILLPNVRAKFFSIAPPKTKVPIFFMLTAPIIRATVSKSILDKKSLIPSQTVFHSISWTAALIVVQIPCTQASIVFARAPKSNVAKKLFTPDAMDSPKSTQSNVLPNERAVYMAVFNAPAIVFPVEPNKSGDINPLRNEANPDPKFLAFS